METTYLEWVRAYRAWKEAAYRLHYVRGEAHDDAYLVLQAARETWIKTDLAYTGRGVVNQSERAVSLLASEQH